jgi:hypothetical protein
MDSGVSMAMRLLLYHISRRCQRGARSGWPSSTGQALWTPPYGREVDASPGHHGRAGGAENGASRRTLPNEVLTTTLQGSYNRVAGSRVCVLQPQEHSLDLFRISFRTGNTPGKPGRDGFLPQHDVLRRGMPACISYRLFSRGPLAQLAEQRTLNPWVEGSTPSRLILAAWWNW